MQKILVPFDGSKAANSALSVALDLAQQHGGGIHILHVLLRETEPDELLTLSGVAEANTELTDALRRLAEAPASEPAAGDEMAHPCAPLHPAPETELRRIGECLLAWAEAHAAERGVKARSLALSEGAPAQAILAAAEDIEADAIVMGSRGLRPIDAFTIGSVSQTVCTAAPCTCIMVH